MFNALRHDGILTTYCAQGQFKRNLKEVGFLIEALPGPTGKREMTRAQSVDSSQFLSIRKLAMLRSLLSLTILF